MAEDRRWHTLRRSDRATGIVLALALQAVLFALLLSSRPQLASPEPLVRELTLILPSLPKLPQPQPTHSRQTVPSFEAPVPAVPLPPNPAVPAATPPDASRLGQSLFGCAPENYANLTPEQRAGCSRPGEGVAVQEAPKQVGVRTQSRDEAHWAAELAARKSIRVPCTGIENQSLGFTKSNQVLMVDPLCANEELLELGKKLR